jgi:membrane associated rhomboid family serine protease
MIIPLAHEDLRGRRWPWVTIAIIALNTVIFLGTNGIMDRQMADIGQAEIHILLLSSRFPDAQMTPEAAEMVGAFKLQHAKAFAVLGSTSRPSLDPYDVVLRARDWTPEEVDGEMASLCTEFARVRDDSIPWNYAFHPVHPTLRSYITATFLHGGWLHLIFNMWFLWLAGTVLEDLWGRIIYPIFYLASGVLALAVHGIVFPHSLVPVLGASGAIAGLMGAFLARFPKTRIRLGWFFFYRFFKFNVPAYIILPLWLLIQVFWGAIFAAFRAEAGVAYWAHIGGFAFGALGAVLLRATGVEQSANEAIEAKVSWTADPRIVRASEAIGENRPEVALAEMKQHVQEQPESLDGWELLLRAQEKSQDVAGQKETLASVVRLRVAQGDLEGAWRDYKVFTNLGGEKLPRGVWLELCRYAEQQHWWELAATEYERLAEANPRERSAVSALVSAGRIQIEQLHRPDRAAKLFHAAAASPAVHSDLDAAIQQGLKQCETAAPQPGTYSR